MINLDWNKYPDKLIPVVVQDNISKTVLMQAYVNKEALTLTMLSGVAHYFSRSRKDIWKKGETSGNTQTVIKILVDCDNDSLLYLVNQNGVACHTGEYSCFFRELDRY